MQKINRFKVKTYLLEKHTDINCPKELSTIKHEEATGFLQLLSSTHFLLLEYNFVSPVAGLMLAAM